jgi:hypothetical protein
MMQDGSAEGFIENRTFDELTLGETASLLMARAGGAV